MKKTDPVVLQIWTEVIRRYASNLGKWGKFGKYPVLNAHYQVGTPKHASATYLFSVHRSC